MSHRRFQGGEVRATRWSMWKKLARSNQRTIARSVRRDGQQHSERREKLPNVVSETNQSFVCLMVTCLRKHTSRWLYEVDRKSSSGCISPPPTGIILLFWCSPRLVSQRQSLLFDRSFVSLRPPTGPLPQAPPTFCHEFDWQRTCPMRGGYEGGSKHWCVLNEKSRCCCCCCSFEWRLWCVKTVGSLAFGIFGIELHILNIQPNE